MAAMIYKQDGIHIDTKDKFVIIDGRSHTIPEHVKCHNVTTINGTVYMGGYELQSDGTWKRTLKAMYHYFF